MTRNGKKSLVLQHILIVLLVQEPFRQVTQQRPIDGTSKKGSIDFYMRKASKSEALERNGSICGFLEFFLIRRNYMLAPKV